MHNLEYARDDPGDFQVAKILAEGLRTFDSIVEPRHKLNFGLVVPKVADMNSCSMGDGDVGEVHKERSQRLHAWISSDK